MSLTKSNLFLTGFMGVGKSRVGRELARISGRSFFDLDAQIMEKQGLTISEVFTKLGEAGFRKIESTALQEICQMEENRLIVSLGGGATLSQENRNLIQSSGVLVYLHATPEGLARRLERNYKRRPALADCDSIEKLQTRIREMLAAREPLYRQNSIVISTEGRTPESIAHVILKQVIEANGPES